MKIQYDTDLSVGDPFNTGSDSRERPALFKPNNKTRMERKEDKRYPFKIQVIKNDQVLRDYCGVRLWSYWNARLEKWTQGRKNPQVKIEVKIKKTDSPQGEVTLFLNEVKFIE